MKKTFKVTKDGVTYVAVETEAGSGEFVLYVLGDRRKRIVGRIIGGKMYTPRENYRPYHYNDDDIFDWFIWYLIWFEYIEDEQYREEVPEDYQGPVEDGVEAEDFDATAAEAFDAMAIEDDAGADVPVIADEQFDPMNDDVPESESAEVEAGSDDSFGSDDTSY